MLAVEDEYDSFFARGYDALYAAHRDPVGDREFYLGLAHKYGGPLLELGCGTGRVLRPIFEAGISCVGIDASASMLERVNVEREAPIETQLAAMQSFDLGRKFSLITAPFRSFQHLYSVEDQLACLTCVRQHLAPGGRFAFDVFDPDLGRLADEEVPEFRDIEAPFEGGTLIRYAALRNDHAEQRMHAWFRLEHHRDGQLVADHAHAIRMRWFYRYEIEHLLARAGFHIEHLYSDFQRSPYDGWQEIVIIAS